MDHQIIEKQALVERYFRGDLPAADEAAFEAHYFGCARCQEALVEARDLSQGLKAVAAQQATAAAVNVGLFAWARQGRGWALAALLASVVAVPAFLLGRADRGPTDRSSDGTAIASAGANLVRPLAAAPVFLLAAVRDQDVEPVVIDRAWAATAEAFTLAIDAGVDAGFSSYSASVVDGEGVERFRTTGLEVSPLEAIMLTFPVEFFSPGDYRLILDGLGSDGVIEDVGTYSFRVTASR